MEYCLLFVTCPSPAVGESIARALVDERLAACGNVMAPVTSVYRWKGEVQRETEALLIVKTRRSLVENCVGAIRRRHPYELPEIIALPVVGGLPEYLRWIGTETMTPTPNRVGKTSRRSREAAP